MNREKSAQMHAAKARKRMAEPAPDYPALDYDLPVESLRHTDHRTGAVHQLTLFHSRLRRGNFRVNINGKEWRKSIGYDRLLRGLRTAMFRGATTRPGT